MTERQQATSPADAARIAVAGVILAGGALVLAGQAAADPMVPTPAPGQPVVSAEGPPPPPVGAPPVPQIPNPMFGNNLSGSEFGYVEDVWRSFGTDNPLGELTAAPGQVPGAPPGAGPPPPLPPGTVSFTAPESSTAPPEGVWLGPLPGLPPVPLTPPVPAAPPPIGEIPPAP